jgi:hypothetical protein
VALRLEETEDLAQDRGLVVEEGLREGGREGGRKGARGIEHLADSSH